MNIIQKLYLSYLKRTDTIKWARKLGVKIGKNCRLLSVTFSTEPYLIEIGDHVSATNVHFETHDGGVWVFRDKHPKWDIIKKIKIGNNVYIGTGTIILPGVKIGDNIIIGAKSVVTKDLESNFVYAGIPAKKIKTIDEYYNKISTSVIETKHLSSMEKHKFLLLKYSNDI